MAPAASTPAGSDVIDLGLHFGPGPIRAAGQYAVHDRELPLPIVLTQLPAIQCVFLNRFPNNLTLGPAQPRSGFPEPLYRFLVERKSHLYHTAILPYW